MRALTHLIAAAAITLLSPPLFAQESLPADARPAWLQERIAGFEALPEHEAPMAVWQLTRKGLPAYLVISPCCDQYNPLLDGQGKQICSPTGGIVGRGDGHCPFPADRGTPVKLLWLHPKSTVQSPSPPLLAKP